jgi:protein O-GlcNAc transferase
MPFFLQKNMKKNITSNDPNLLFEKALNYQRLNDSKNTEHLCKYILNLYPDHLGAAVLLATIYINSENLIGKGISLIQSVLKKEVKNFFIHNLHGVALMKIGKHQEAKQSFLNAIRLNPNDPDINFNLGVLSGSANEYSKAISFYSKCIEINHNYANAFFNRGNIYMDNLCEYESAIQDYQRFIELIPTTPFGYYNLGKALGLINRHDEALINYEKAITLNPAYAEAYINVGNILSALNRHDEALINYEKAITLKPDADYIAGWIMNSKKSQADWKGHDDLRENIIKGTTNLNNICHPFILLSVTDDLKIQRISAEIFLKKQISYMKTPTIYSMKYGHKKIRIGYFSSDFHNHATMHLMAEMLEKHNKETFEIIGFSFGRDIQDDWRIRAEKSFNDFYNVSNMSDEEIANLSRKLEIDIAIDLKGYTQENRFAIFFYRAAPIQINYLGYPGTLGAKYIDYIIADRNLIPENKKAFYSEKIIYLPGCYQPNCAERDVDQADISRKELGLPENAFVYCAFNNIYKITPQIFLSWTNILHKVNNSVIWILSDSKRTNENLLREFNAKGIDSQRIIFAKRMPIEKHLARLGLADLFLDTFPYGAHTTASDALRVGLPVLTMIGQSFASRVASSLLKQLELTELITEKEQDYESMAIQLGSNLKKFNSIKEKLSNNLQKTDLFNPKFITANIELAFEKVYDIYLNDEAPQDIYIN